MGETEIRAGIKSVLEAVEDIGKVHDYDRWTVDWAKFIELFKDTASKRILGWEITRKNVKEDETSVRPHVYVIRGYMGLKDEDETEKTFNTLVEDVCAAFRADKRLGGGALGHDFIQVETLDVRTFGSVLCHYAELSLTVHEHKE